MSSMPPKRQPGSRDLPPNLYDNTDTRSGVTYYRYRDPRTGRFHGLGTDKTSAIKDAKAINARLLAEQAGHRIEAIATTPTVGERFSVVLARHEELNEDRARRGKLAANTIKTKTSNARTLRAEFGNQALNAITVRDLATLFDRYVKQGKERMAQSIRSESIEVWKTAIAEGWTNDNPAAKTRPIDVEVKRARLTLSSLMAIYDAALELDPWVARSIELALLTGQRREDVAGIEFRPRKGAGAWIEDGSLWVIQKKTGNRVTLPLDLRLEAFRMSLGEAIARSRDAIVSRYLVHHQKKRTKSMPGDQVWIDTISKNFAKARDLAARRASVPLWDTDKAPPTYHELRSLAERLYNDQGNVDTQTLLGHKDPRSTAIYKDTRGAEWMRVKIG